MFEGLGHQCRRFLVTFLVCGSRHLERGCAGQHGASGNHVIAEMGMLVYGDADGHAVFTMDKPSSAFGDRKVANLLRIVGVDADQVF